MKIIRGTLYDGEGNAVGEDGPYQAEMKEKRAAKAKDDVEVPSPVEKKTRQEKKKEDADDGQEARTRGKERSKGR